MSAFMSVQGFRAIVHHNHTENTMAARKSAIYVAILRRLRRDAIEDLSACGWEAGTLAMLFDCSERTITRTRAQIRETRIRMAKIAALKRRLREAP